MAFRVLITTPHAAFGELIRQSLEQTGSYLVHISTSSAETLAACQKVPFNIVILDADIEDEPFVALAMTLKAFCPCVSLVVFPPDNDPNSPLMGDLIPDAFLQKPFYLPDLLETMEALVSETADAGTAAESDPKWHVTRHLPGHVPADAAWLDNLDHIVVSANRLALDSFSQAGLVVFADEVVVYAGRLEVAQADRIASLAYRWRAENVLEVSDVPFTLDEPEGETDLTRYLHLGADEASYLLYMTTFTPDVALILLFSEDTPLSHARENALRLKMEIEMQSPQKTKDQGRPFSGGRSPSNSAVEPVRTGHSHFPANFDDEELPLAGEESLGADLQPLFADVPSPDPTPVSTLSSEGRSGWIHEETRIPLTQPEIPLKPAVQGSARGGPQGSVDGLASRAGDVDVLHFPPAELGEDDRAQVFISPHTDTILESISPAIANITFTCVFIPRLPGHFLRGELASQLGKWMSQLCVAYGWNLEGLAIRPDHLEWIIRVPPSISPGEMLHLLRMRTSQRIFSVFANLTMENPSGDFWAPGYMIVSGSRSLPPQVLREYIALTRQRQSIANS
jgi:REP element-mobilizing transposase RayT/DNA-binding response OmpR family regulator